MIFFSRGKRRSGLRTDVGVEEVANRHGADAGGRDQTSATAEQAAFLGGRAVCHDGDPAEA